MVDSSGDADLRRSSQTKRLVVEDMLRGDKENDGNGVMADPGSTLCFPAEFPYDFDFLSEPSALASPVESVKDSTEMVNTDDEEDFLAALTHRLTQSSIRETRKFPSSSFSNACEKTEKKWGLAHSPQSTLSGLESWSASSTVSSGGSPNGPSQIPSPTSTPFPVKNDNWDVIYAAAGQVARLKMNGEAPPNSVCQTLGLFSTLHKATQVPQTPNNIIYQSHDQTIGKTSQQLSQINRKVRQDQILKRQCSSIWARQAEVTGLLKQETVQNRRQSTEYYSGHRVRTNCFPQTAWFALRFPHDTQPSRYYRSAFRSVPVAGYGVKRECAGTGVFLPRSYDGDNIEPRKKKICSSVMLSRKPVFPRTFEGSRETRFKSGFPSEHDVMAMASRNAPFFQQRRHLRQIGVVNQDIPFHRNGHTD